MILEIIKDFHNWQPNYSKLAGVLAATSGFVSFHFLYSDGWSFDGTWSKLKQLRERMWPSPENRIEGWWHSLVGYVCAFISAVLWIFAILL